MSNIKITKIIVNNFKSLVDFELQMSQFNCLVGLNGAGKSTVLQFFDFLSQLVSPFGINEFLAVRNWKATDLNSQLSKKNNIDLTIFLTSNTENQVSNIKWIASFNRNSLTCTTEEIIVDDKKILSVVDGKYKIDGEQFPIVFKYQGSILSALNDKQTYPILTELTDFISHIRSLDLLSPELLRSKTRSSEGKLGLGGERLSALIHESNSERKETLVNKLKEVYPHLDGIKTKSLQSGWKQLEIIEDYQTYHGKKMTSVARQTNDGMLRLMAIIMQLEMDNQFLLFDEIENGINQELIEYLVTLLVKSEKQVMITTHSPMILNFLEDDVASQSVIYLYKNKQGCTQSIPFFNLPTMKAKLEYLPPGVVFSDTDLTTLDKEIELMKLL